MLQRQTKLTAKQIESMMWGMVKTKTLLRMWERRLLVALTPEEETKCKAKIKQYKHLK